MGIDLSVTKTFGFKVPLETVAKPTEDYWELTETLDEISGFTGIRYGTSGSFQMTGAKPGDVFWVGIARLTEDEDPESSSGLVWTFHEVPTDEERNTLLKVAKEHFDLDEPTLEHLVVLSVF